MQASLKYLVFLLVSVCYLQAAFEINAGPVTNTWDDGYDTYIHPDQNAGVHFGKADEGAVLLSVLLETFNGHSTTIEESPGSALSGSDHYPPPKLFITHHRLLI